MNAAEDFAAGFHTVSKDATIAVRADGCQRVDRALETVERVMLASYDHFKCLVIFIFTDFTCSHTYLSRLGSVAAVLTYFEGVEITRESDSFSLGGGMEIPKQLIECLNENKVVYEILRHPEAVTAQRIAQAEHVKGRHHAKVVIIKSGDEHLMMVLPADHHIDLEKAEKAIGKPVSLGKEQEFESLFPDCATGAMPPLGNLYGLPTYVDKSLAEQAYIVFEAGTHSDAIKISYRDYEKIVKPNVNDLAVKLQPMKGV
jgi:Ala-tRNA(Pro) deacylase